MHGANAIYDIHAAIYGTNNTVKVKSRTISALNEKFSWLFSASFNCALTYACMESKMVVCSLFYMRSSIQLQCLSSMSTYFPSNRLTCFDVCRKIVKKGIEEYSIPIIKSQADWKNCIYWSERAREQLLRAWCFVINFSKIELAPLFFTFFFLLFWIKIYIKIFDELWMHPWLIWIISLHLQMQEHFPNREENPWFYPCFDCFFRYLTYRKYANTKKWHLRGSMNFGLMTQKNPNSQLLFPVCTIYVYI